MTHITLMRGIPGGGKSTVAKSLAFTVYSTDDYWFLPSPPNVVTYKFDRRKIEAAHLWNQKRAEDAIKAKFNHIIIDNTNITPHAVGPYFDMAVKYGCTISILAVDTPLDECIRRNALRSEDRRVPESAIRRMHAQMGFMSADQELEKAKARVK